MKALLRPLCWLFGHGQAETLWSLLIRCRRCGFTRCTTWDEALTLRNGGSVRP